MLAQKENTNREFRGHCASTSTDIRTNTDVADTGTIGTVVDCYQRANALIETRCLSRKSGWVVGLGHGAAIHLGCRVADASLRSRLPIPESRERVGRFTANDIPRPQADPARPQNRPSCLLLS